MTKVRVCLILLVLFGLWGLSGCKKSQKIDKVVSPRIAELHESFTEPAQTRLEKTYRIAMPVAGRIGRIELEPGDAVQAGQVLAVFDRLPLEQRVVEARSAVNELTANLSVQDYHQLEETAKLNTQASIDAAEQSLKAAEAQVEAQEARYQRSVKELERVEQLAQTKTLPQSELDDARLEAETSLIEWRRQEFNASAFRFLYVATRLGPRFIEEWLSRKSLNRDVFVEQLAQAQARLKRAEHELSLASIVSPIDGVVLEKYDQGDNSLPGGQQLLLLGDLAQLEIIVDVLTQDALRLTPGAKVQLEAASRLPLISGEVKRIEPAGFTKLSSLGVEQQRVNVIVALAERPAGLGVGYRLQARFFTASKADALVVPRFSVLQAPYRPTEDGDTPMSLNGSFYVLKIEEGKLVKQPVELGLRSDLFLEITSGLSASDEIVATPSANMEEGAKVKLSKK
jgi:HlyD family secretion protein